MELVPVNQRQKNANSDKSANIIGITPVEEEIVVESKMNGEVEGTPKFDQKPFIEANTKEITLKDLSKDCIIPVFAKDNERTIAHQEFIEIAQECAGDFFKTEQIALPEIRVSHQVKGRTSNAMHKSAKELLEHEKTKYYERMAFVVRIPSITADIYGNTLSLMIGGVRAYNQENLYSKRTYEKFKFFIGFQNMVCCNMCISSDGFVSEMRVGSYEELRNKISEVLQAYQAEKHLQAMKQLTEYSLTEHQFAQLVGKAKLYNYLPKDQKRELPKLDFADRQINMIAKDYYGDKRFCRDENGVINLWNVYNLFTSANKSSYIDSFLDRNVNAFHFSVGLANAINGDSDYHWFLS
jgi:hypothetical protein